LNDTRILVGEFLDSPDIVITHGIDIMADLSNQEHPIQTDTSTSSSSSVMSHNNGLLSQKIGESAVIDEDESDGWKFDEEEEEEGTSEVDDNNNPLDTSEWKWEDNDDELENGNDKIATHDGNDNSKNDNDAFPYSISAIPDKLMDLINRLLDESQDL
jgi:hypothetical protein